jgi:hypothetical protein
MNPGYNGFGHHPWEDIFVVTAEDEVICGPCLPDHIDPADTDVEVWAFASEGWLAPCVCTVCGLSIPVYVNGEQNERREHAAVATT